LTPFPAREGGKFGGALRLGGGKTLANPKPAGVGKTGGPGGAAPWRGVVGGVPPQNQKRGRVAHISNPATSGAQNAGEPKAHGGGKTGVQGAQAPLAGGCGGCPPTKPKEGASCPHQQPGHEWGPKRWRTQSPRGWANGGSRGRSPLPGGLGDVPPKFSKKERAANSYHPATRGTQNAGEPSANEGGAMGVQGGGAPWRGVVGGVPPQNQKRGRVVHISNAAPSGAQNAGEPKAHGGGKTGGPGGAAPWQGAWGMCPHNFEKLPTSNHCDPK
jgi:hypothetical protein